MSNSDTPLLTKEEVQQNKSRIAAIEFNQRMLDTIKYTIWSVILMTYVFFIGAIFIKGHWAFGLAGIFFIASAWPLRELWHKNARHKDEIINSKDYDPEDPILKSSMRIQKTLALGLMLATFICSGFFIFITYSGIDSLNWGIAALVGMIFTELLDWYNRSTSKKLGALHVLRSNLINTNMRDYDRKKEMNSKADIEPVNRGVGSDTFTDGVKLQ